MSTTSMMFTALLQGSSPAPLDLQEQVYRYADRTGNVALLATLASYRHLEPTLEEKLRDRDELNVLLEWAARPNRTQEEVVARFRGEKRATLLDHVASSAGLPAEVYEYIGKRNAVGLNWALLGNSAAPESVRMVAATSLGATTTQRNSGLYAKLQTLLSVEDKLSEAFARASRNPLALAWLAQSQPTPSSSGVLVAVAQSAFELLKEEDLDCLYTVRTLTSRTDLPEEVNDLLAGDFLAVAKSLQSPPSWALTEIVDEIARYEERRKFDDAAWLEKISSAATPMLIMQAVSDYQSIINQLRLRQDYWSVAHAVLLNPNVDASLVRNYAHRGLTEDLAREIGTRAVAEKSHALAEALLHSAYLNGWDLLAEFYNSSDDPEGLLRWFTSSDSKSVPGFVSGSSLIRDNPDLAMAYLPAAAVLGNVSYTEAVRARLSALAQADDRMWDTLTTLAEDWEDSFDGLVAAVADLSRE